jgi:hypothetical protein
MSEKTTVSVNEFKNWLDGVLDFQPEGWSPNAEQWEKIKNKIDQLEDTVVERQPAPAAPAQQQPRANPNQQPVAQKKPRPEGPLTNLDMDETVKLPDKPIQRKRHVHTQKTSDPKVVDSGNGRKVIDTGTVHKMGEIDTSDGNYESSFI